MTLAADLANYTAEIERSDVDQGTIDSVKLRLLDSLICSFAAKGTEPVERLLSFTTKTKDEDAHVIGTSEKASIEYAAQSNTALIRYIDWNDTHLAPDPGAGHPSSWIGPILAVADAYDCPGSDVILAIVLNYELHCRIADAVNLFRRGFDSTNYGLIAATLSVGKLLNLSENELIEALRLALIGNTALLQTRRGELSVWKGLAESNTARQAVLAALFANQGITGPSPIFEGERGFFNQISGEFSLSISDFGGREGEFMANKTLLKPYPIVTHAIPAVDCVFSLLEEKTINWREIDHIEIETYADAIMLNADPEKWDPQNRNTADHSIPYCVSRLLIDKEMTLRQLQEDKVLDPEVRDLIDKIDIVENESFTEQYGEYMPTKVTIDIGPETYQYAIDAPHGHPRSPFTTDDLATKFQQVSPEFSEENRAAIFDYVDSIEEKSRLSPITEPGLFSLLNPT